MTCSFSQCLRGAILVAYPTEKWKHKWEGVVRLAPRNKLNPANWALFGRHQLPGRRNEVAKSRENHQLHFGVSNLPSKRACSLFVGVANLGLCFREILNRSQSGGCPLIGSCLWFCSTPYRFLAPIGNQKETKHVRHVSFTAWSSLVSIGLQ